jgi:CO dehydrogenase/acetyl-CoA synthase beta subunit
VVTTIQEAWENDKSLSLDKYEAELGSWSIRQLLALQGHAWISNTDNEEEEEEEEEEEKTRKQE